MPNDFKVLEWLREVRDQNAREEADLTVEQRLARTKKQAAPLMSELRKRQREAAARRPQSPADERDAAG